MKPIRREDLDALMTDTQGPAISLYLPTVRAGREVQQNPIRFGNLVREVERRLAERDDIDESTRSALLAPLIRMRDDHEFWQHQDHGLAVYRGRERTSAHALPVPVETSAHIGPAFVVRPVLPLVDFDGRFHVVEFGQETVNLYVGTRYELRPVILPEDTPTCLADVVGHRLSGPHVQHHSGNGPGQAAVFHGQGAGETKEDGELRKYAAWVARTLPAAMDPDAPVVLAGTENNVGLFRKVCDWNRLCADWIHGAPGRFEADDLHEKSWAVAEPVIRARRMRHLGAIEGLESKGKATHDLDDAIDAARAGRVEALYLTDAIDADPARIETLARETWIKGGRVFEVDQPMLPGDRTFEAVMRY